MKRDIAEEIRVQREYYRNTAARYDALRVGDEDEYDFALALLPGLIQWIGVESVLDVGSGTGRALLKLRQSSDVRLVGVEPSPELRAEGLRKGLDRIELVDGNAMALAFDDGSFDLVCAFGVLHHIPKPAQAVSEMLRVARKAIFIGDTNNFGEGGPIKRILKQGLNSLGLWNLTDLIKTKGKGYTISEGDGLSYSYSLFNDYNIISRGCSSVRVINTIGKSINHYRQSPNVAILGIK